MTQVASPAILSSLCLLPPLSARCLLGIVSVCVCVCVGVQVAGSVPPPTPPHAAALLSGSVAVGCVVPMVTGMKPDVRCCFAPLCRQRAAFLISPPSVSIRRTRTRCR